MQRALLPAALPGTRQEVTPVTLSCSRTSRRSAVARPSKAGLSHGRLRGETVCAAAEVKAVSAPPSTKKEEFYDVYLDKPLGLRFQRGNDGGAYVIKSDPKIGNTDSRIEVGDKIVKISASFGEDVWEALNFGQVMYAIKTRNGQVYLKMLKKYGDLSALEEEELSEVEKLFRAERGGGNYGVGTKEKQAANYLAAKQREKERLELFELGLSKFKKGDIQGALIDFEEVIALEPLKYIGDDFSRVTQVYRVAQYNVGCCYSSIDQIEAGLEALESAMANGFEQYSKIRSDPNLANLRKSKKFTELINKYDEPVINENAIKALKSIFSFGKKNDGDE